MGVNRKQKGGSTAKYLKNSRGEQPRKSTGNNQGSESPGKQLWEFIGKMISQEYLWENNKNQEKDSKGESTREQRGKSLSRVR